MCSKQHNLQPIRTEKPYKHKCAHLWPWVLKCKFAGNQCWYIFWPRNCFINNNNYPQMPLTHVFNIILHSSIYLRPRMARWSPIESYPWCVYAIIALQFVNVLIKPQKIRRNTSTLFWNPSPEHAVFLQREWTGLRKLQTDYYPTKPIKSLLCHYCSVSTINCHWVKNSSTKWHLEQ